MPLITVRPSHQLTSVLMAGYLMPLFSVSLSLKDQMKGVLIGTSVNAGHYCPLDLLNSHCQESTFAEASVQRIVIGLLIQVCNKAANRKIFGKA